MDTFYSDQAPRYRFDTEQALQAAVDSELLEEGHYLEIKREIKPKKQGNDELARDVASLAVDGGMMIVGLEEIEPGIFALAPQSLAGLPERIEQIARSIPDPPVGIKTTVVRSERSRSTGYVLVHVPISPGMPHMVRGEYFGRGDKTKIRLDDSQVRRLHERRKISREVGQTALDELIASDPIHSDNGQAHLFLVAIPVAGHHELLQELVEDTKDWEQQLTQLVRAASVPQAQLMGPWAAMLT